MGNYLPKNNRVDEPTKRKHLPTFVRTKERYGKQKREAVESIAVPKWKYPLWFWTMVAVITAMLIINAFFFILPSAALYSWLRANIGSFQPVRLLEWFQVNIISAQLLSGFGTLVASFMGAWFAFSFAKYQRDRERIEKEVAAGNHALFVLTVFYNRLRQHQKEIVDPYRNKPDAWINLHATLPIDLDFKFEAKELAFLLQLDAAIFQSLFLEEDRFSIVAHAVAEHKRILSAEAWPRLEAAGIKLNSNHTNIEIEDALGPAITQQLKVITKAIIDNVDSDVVSIMDAFVHLRTALKRVYQKQNFIDFKPQ